MSTTLPLTSERALEASNAVHTLEIAGVSRTYRASRKGRGSGRGGGREPHGAERRAERRQTQEALRGVSLTIEHGSFVALLGPNGSGKSTLLRILSTAEQPDAGTFRFGSLSPLTSTADARAFRARIGVVFQSPGLDPLLSVRENLNLAAVLAGISSSEIAGRVTSLAREFEITDRLDERVKTLSGGLARRVDLCRAMLGGPSLLLLDEASTGLDHRARLGFFGAIERSRAVTGSTILFATHMMDEAERADRVVMMHEGRVVADDTPEALRASVGMRMVRVHAHTPDEVAHATSIFDRDDVPQGKLDVAPASGAKEQRMNTVAGPLPLDPEDRKELLDRLASGGFTFEVGRPTLGDAYLKATGAPLDAGVASDGGPSS